MEPRTTKLLAAFSAVIAALFVFTPRSAPAVFGQGSRITTFHSAPSKSGRRMHWFRSHAVARTLERGVARFGSTAIIGLESMRDLASL